jgi:hypothetical protein
MLTLLLDHPPRFVAGEIATGLEFALFIGARTVAIADRLPELCQLREARRSIPPIVRRSVGQAR